MTYIEELKDCIRNLQRQRTALRRAVEFYAAIENWQAPDALTTAPADADFGARARQALHTVDTA